MASLTLEFLSFDISIDENVPYWNCSVEVSNIQDFESINKGDTFTITIVDESWTFVVESKKLDRSNPASTSFNITGRSATCLLEPPFRVPLTYTLFEDVSAKETVLNVLEVTSIDWQLKDSTLNELNWVLPKYSLAESNTTRTEIAKRIIEAAGGVLECTPDGKFVARPLFPISPLQYDTIVPDHTFTDVDNILSLSYDYTGESFYDYVRVRNTNTSEPSDKAEMVFDEGQNLVGSIRVYPFPFRDIDLETTASSAVVTLDYSSKKEEFGLEEDEVIEFAKGTASTRQPIYEIVSIKWQDVDLKGVTFDRYTNNLYSVDPALAYSMARVTYKTRYYSWRVSANKDYEAQFLTVDPNV